MTEHISLTPLKPSQLPADSEDPNYVPFVSSLIHASSLFLASLPPLGESTTTWPLHKVFHQSHCPTFTYSSEIDAPPPGVPVLEHGLRWHCRISQHRGVSWESFRDGLMVNHSSNEQQYIEDSTAAERLKVIDEGVLEAWRTAYHLPFPTTNRDFTFLILTKETTDSEEGALRSFVVISIPYEAELAKGFVRGRYVSIEHVIETPERDGVLWTMATASNAEGSIPRLITEKAMPSKISEDVPSFLKWLGKRGA